MPKRKPPCPPNCKLRKPACQSTCKTFAPYAEQIKQDRLAKQHYFEETSTWTQSRTNIARQREKTAQKKAQGVKL
jgi:hypothetical protein